MIRAGLFYAVALFSAQAQQSLPPASAHSSSPACHTPKQLSPPESKRLQLVPKKLDYSKFNRQPLVTFVIKEDGSISAVKLVRGSGSAKVDAGLVKSIRAWKFEPQAGCAIDNKLTITIGIS